MKIKLLVGFILITINLFSQNEDYIICVGKLVSYELDTEVLAEQRRFDSIQRVEENIAVMRFSNPIVVNLKVKKVFTTDTLEENLKFRIWVHTIGGYFDQKGTALSLILGDQDKNGVYSTYFYGQAYRRWSLNWAETVNGGKIYCKSKKPLFRNRVMKKERAERYQLLKHQAKFCKDEINRSFHLQSRK